MRNHFQHCKWFVEKPMFLNKNSNACYGYVNHKITTYFATRFHCFCDVKHNWFCLMASSTSMNSLHWFLNLSNNFKPHFFLLHDSRFAMFRRMGPWKCPAHCTDKAIAPRASGAILFPSSCEHLFLILLIITSNDQSRGGFSKPLTRGEDSLHCPLLELGCRSTWTIIIPLGQPFSISDRPRKILHRQQAAN